MTGAKRSREAVFAAVNLLHRCAAAIHCLSCPDMGQGSISLFGGPTKITSSDQDPTGGDVLNAWEIAEFNIYSSSRSYFVTF